VLATAYAGLAVAAGIVPVLGPVAAVLVLAAEAAVRRSVADASQVLGSAGADAGVRCLVRGSLLVVVAVRAAELPTPLVAGLVTVVTLLAVAPVAGQLLGRRAELRIRDQVRWQDLDVAGRSAGPAAVPLPGARPPAYAREDAGPLLEWPLVVAVGVAVLASRRVPGSLVLGAALVAVTAGCCSCSAARWP
jgi:hypothetical protein